MLGNDQFAAGLSTEVKSELRTIADETGGTPGADLRCVPQFTALSKYKAEEAKASVREMLNSLYSAIVLEIGTDSMFTFEQQQSKLARAAESKVT